SPFYALNGETRPVRFQLADPSGKNLKNVDPRDARVRDPRVLCDYYIVYVEVALHKKTRLVDSPPVLADRDRLVARVDLDHDDLLIRPFRHPDLLQTRRRQTIPDKSLGSLSILDHFYLPAGHPAEHVDVLPALANGEPHVSRLRNENNPLKLLVDNTVLGCRAGDALEEGHVLHLLTGQLDLGLEHHFFSATSFRTSESPASRTTSADTGKGFSQTAPSSRLEPGKM